MRSLCVCVPVRWRVCACVPVRYNVWLSKYELTRAMRNGGKCEISYMQRYGIAVAIVVRRTYVTNVVANVKTAV